MQLASLRPVWPLLTVLASGAMLAAAHAFERFGGLQPCALCLDQRKWHWAVVALSLVALVVLRFQPSFSRLAVLLIGVVLLGSAAMGAYHVAVEQHWVIAQCDARLDASQSLSFDVNAPLVIPRCDEIQWQLWGISMAGYNAIISLLLALASFGVGLATERKP
jgi:disulfide bond formation protein DsbB